jgi:hypothetical protein
MLLLYPAQHHCNSLSVGRTLHRRRGVRATVVDAEPTQVDYESEGRRFESCRARNRKRLVCRINADRPSYFSSPVSSRTTARTTTGSPKPANRPREGWAFAQEGGIASPGVVHRSVWKVNSRKFLS